MKNILIVLALCVPFFAAAQKTMFVSASNIKVTVPNEGTYIYDKNAAVIYLNRSNSRFYLYVQQSASPLHNFRNSEVTVSGGTGISAYEKLDEIAALSSGGGGGGGGGVMQIDPTANTIKIDPLNNNVDAKLVNSSGAALSTNAGAVDNATLRVTLPSDVTPSFNQAQINGVAVTTGNGAATTGTARVSIATDGNRFVPVNSAGTNLSMDAGASSAATLRVIPSTDSKIQSVNSAGTNLAMNAGAADAATPRVITSSDSKIQLINGAGNALATNVGASDATVLRTTSTIVTNSTENLNNIIDVGGVAEPLFASNPSRLGFEIKNHGTTDLKYSIGGTASATVGAILSPGQGYSSPSHVSTSAAITVWSATTGHPFWSIQYAP
ncbi:MAG: hypothetical protein ACRCVX_14170 [Shewanella sp.]